ncbi:MAG: hypothetical protein LBI68_00095 [Azoarcus sp.]|jgi:hypothetical protein|nr:hypothetical protein [Azoarcus sp.]
MTVQDLIERLMVFPGDADVFALSAVIDEQEECTPNVMVEVTTAKLINSPYFGNAVLLDLESI